MAKIALYCARYGKHSINIEPLGISYIFSYLIEQGIAKRSEVLIVDSYKELQDFRPDIVGISSVSQVINDAIDFARKCKKEFNCITVLGGYHVSCMHSNLPTIFDIGVIGEGELTFAELVKAYNCKLKSIENLKEIKGICYWLDSKIEITLPRGFIENLDMLPIPFRHEKYSEEIAVITSRGCPYKCIYCASHKFWQDKVRYRSAKNVIEEIQLLVDLYRPKIINIVDDLWIADKLRFREMVKELINSEISERVTFTGFVRSNLVTEEDIILLKKMNYKFIRFGAETGSDKLLKRIKGNNISIFDHQRLIDLCAKHRIPCGGSFIFGIPGETRDDINETISFLRKNKDKLSIAGFYFFNPIPGTDIWRDLEKDNLINKDIDFQEMYIDFLNIDFKWIKGLYFNEENIPFEEFKEIIHDIKNEFILKENEVISMDSTLSIHKFRKSKRDKLEFGCGESLREGFTGVDIRKCFGVRYNCNAWDITEFVEENTVSEIFSRHFFEHLTYPQADKTLQAWKRILYPGGVVELIIPDINYHIKQFANDNVDLPAEFNPNYTILEHAIAGLWGWQRDGDTQVWDIHKSGYNFELLKRKLTDHGFINIKWVEDKLWNLHVRCEKTVCAINDNDKLLVEENEFTGKGLILFGASNYGEMVFELLSDIGITVNNFCDNDSKKWGKEFCGIKIISPDELADKYMDSNILITSMYFRAISEQLTNLGFERIYYLDKCEKAAPATPLQTPQGLNSGERQVGCTLDKIRPDHIARYELAEKYCKSNHRVLDIACGIGYGSYIMSPDCASITAVDISSEAIEYAKVNYSAPNIEYLSENCMSIILSPEYFDLITCFETLEHIQDDMGFLTKLYTALKARGKLLISCPNQLELPYSAHEFPFHYRHYKPMDIINSVNKAGFSVQHIYSQPYRKQKTIVDGWEGKYIILVCTK